MPIPAYPILILGGAIAGPSTFSLGTLCLVTITGALIADTFWYVAGKRYGRKALAKLCKISFSPDACIQQTESIFLRIGPVSLLFCKFIPGFASVSSAMAGALGLKARTFFFLDGLGAALWAGSAIALGKMFDTAINDLLEILILMGQWGAMLLVGVITIFIARKWWLRQRFIRDLRMSRISVEDLYQRMQSDNPPIILDTRPEHHLAEGWIPGAKHIQVEHIQQYVDEINADQEMILYCDCPNEVTAAKIAKAFIDQGFYNVRPLAGGINAWIENGYAISNLR